MTDWSIINSEHELDTWEREEYAFRIRHKEARARARKKALADLERWKRERTKAN